MDTQYSLPVVCILHFICRDNCFSNRLYPTKIYLLRPYMYQDIHKDLEHKLAKFHNREDAILYASCFDANAGFFETLLGQEDAVLSDELNHASIIDGIRLCKAKRMRYRHMDMEGQQMAVKPFVLSLSSEYEICLYKMEE